MEENTKKFPRGILTVKVESCEIRSKNRLLEQDPYVVLKLKNITFQTDIKLKTTNPEWNQSFTFDLSENTFQDELILQLLDHHKFVSDNLLGQIAITLEEFIVKRQIKSKPYSIFSSKASKSREPIGELLISSIFQEDPSSKPIKQKKDVLTAADLSFDGLVKLTILSGINLLANSSIKSGYLSLTTYKERRTTKHFRSAIAQIQTSFLFPISCNEKPWYFELHNKKTSSRESDKTVAFGELDITKLYLIVNKPFTYGLMLNGIAGAKLLIEIRFLSSGFIRNPMGTIRVEFTNLPCFKKEAKEPFYRMFYNGEYMKIRCDKPGSGHEIRIIRTKNVLEAFNLEYFESSSSMKEKITHGLVPQKPKGSYRVNFCDLVWKEEKNKNFEAFVKGKMSIKSKSLEFCMLLTFTNQSQFTISQSLTNKEESPAFDNKGNPEEPEENQEIIDPNSVPTLIQRKPREKTFTIFKRSLESASPVVVLELTSLHLRGFPLLSFEKQPIEGGVYLRIAHSESNEAFLTNMNKNLSRLYWENDIPLVVSSAETVINFTLAGTVFGEFKENEGFSPWEMLNFELLLRNLEESVYFVPLKQTLKLSSIGKGFEAFLQKTHERKEIDAFKEITLDISFKLHASSLISHPQGILRIQQVSLQEFQLTNSRDNFTFLQDPCITLSLSSQTSHISDNILTNRQSQRPVFFITNTTTENLLVQIDEQRQSEGNIAVLRLEIPLYTLRLEEERGLKHFIELEELENSGLHGRLLINFLYTPYRRSPLQNLCKSLRNPQENAAKTLDFPEKTLSFPCKLWVQPRSLRLCDGVKPDFLTLELNASKNSAAIALNSRQGPEFYQCFPLEIENSLQSLFLRLILYEFKGQTACVKEVFLAQIEISRLLLRKPGWNAISLAFVSNTSPTKTLKSSMCVRLRVENSRFSHSFLSFSPLQIRTFASTVPAKRLWSNASKYFLRVFVEGQGNDCLFAAKLSAVEPVKLALLRENTDFGGDFAMNSLDVTCNACDFKANVPTFVGELALCVENTGDCLGFALFRCDNAEVNALESPTFDRLKSADGVFLEFRGCLSTNSLVSLLNGEKTLRNAAFPVKLSREGLTNTKQSLLDEEDDEHSELLDLSLLEYCYVFLQIREFLPFSLENSSKLPEISSKAEEIPQKDPQDSRHLLRVRLQSLGNLSQRLTSVVGRSVFLKKKPQVSENVSLSLLHQANLEATTKKLSASRLALQRFRCEFFEELQLVSQETAPRTLDFWLLNCCLESKFSTNLLDFEEPLSFSMKNHELGLSTRGKVLLSLPVFKEDALETVFRAEILKETGDFVDNSEGTLTISAVEIEEIENKPFLKDFADFSVHFQVVSFRDLKFSLKDEANSESFLEFSAFRRQFLEKTARNSLISLTPMLLSTCSPSECLFLRFLRKSPGNSSQNLRVFPAVFRLSALGLTSSKSLQEQKTVQIAAPCGFLGSSDGNFAVFSVKLALSYQNNADNKDSQALSLEKLVRLRQKFKHFQEKLYKFVYFDPLSQAELEFSPRFLATFREYSVDELKKEFKETASFLEKSRNPGGNSGNLPFFKLSAGTELIFRDSFKKSASVALNCAIFKGNREILLRKSQVLSSESLEITEARSFHEEKVLETCLKILKDLCFFFPAETLEIATICEFSLEFTNKSLEKRSEIAEIALSPSLLLQKQALCLFKPSQTRVFLRIQRASVHENFKGISGKLRFVPHRLVHLPDKAEVFDYKNRELLENSHIDGLLQLNVGLKTDFSMFSLGKDGLFEETLEKREFFFDNAQDSLQFSLFLSRKRQNLQQTHENELLLCESEAFVPLLLRVPGKTYAAFALKPAKTTGNGVFSQFLATLNRKNLFLLCSFEIFPKKWRVFRLFLRKLLFSEAEPGYFAVKGEILLMKGDSLLKISAFESEFVAFDGKTREIALSSGNVVEILYEEDAGDAYFASISVVCEENGEVKALVSRYLPLKTLFLGDFVENREFLLDFPEKMDVVELLLGIGCEDCKENAESRENAGKPDFRTNKIEEILISLLNSNSVEIILLVLKEIHEYLLFSAGKVQHFELMLQMMLMMLPIYLENCEVTAILLQTVYNLFASDAKSANSIAKKQGFHGLLLEILAGIPGFQENLPGKAAKSQGNPVANQGNPAKNLLKKGNSFELVSIKPEIFAKMKKEEIQARLLDNFLARKSSFLANVDRNRALKYSPKDLERLLAYILRITEFCFEESPENCHEILIKVARFAEFLEKHAKVADIFLSDCEKLLRFGFENGETPELLRKVLTLSAQMLQNPELSAKEEDVFLRRLDFFFAKGEGKGVWQAKDVLFFARAMGRAIRENNDGNNCEFLINELTLLHKLLSTYSQSKSQANAEVFEGLKKIIAEEDLLDILLGLLKHDGKTPQNLAKTLVFLNDRLFALLLSVVLLVFKHYGLENNAKMQGFLDFLKKNLKDVAVLNEVKAKSLEEFWQETQQKAVSAKKTHPKKEKLAETQEKRHALGKKYLISRLEWM